jgi:LysM repeat protein
LKHRYLPLGALAFLPLLAVALLLPLNSLRTAAAAPAPFRCSDTSFYFPVNGIIGWTYGDPAATDFDSHGHRTLHTGFDIFADGGHGSAVYAPADGKVSRPYGSVRVNLVFPGVVNAVTGEAGIEMYYSHMTHALVAGQTFAAGDVIGYQAGDHVHVSVGAFIGYDDREISQTQDPSPYFSAALGYNPATTERQDASHWCYSGAPAATALAAPVSETAPAAPASLEYAVQSGDTLGAIAAQFGVTVEDIAAATGLTDLDFLSLGQVLIIPGAGSTSEPPSTPAATSAPAPATSSPNSYTVVDGDTLSSIAAQFGTDIESIVALNNLADPDVLALGDVLLVP